MKISHLCTPAHCVHMNTPQFVLAHVGSGSLQSAHRVFSSRSRRADSLHRGESGLLSSFIIFFNSVSALLLRNMISTKHNPLKYSRGVNESYYCFLDPLHNVYACAVNVIRRFLVSFPGLIPEGSTGTRQINTCDRNVSGKRDSKQFHCH